MRRTKGLHFASAFLVITHITLISSTAQTSLLRQLRVESSNSDTTTPDNDAPRTSTSASSPAPVESSPPYLPPAPASLMPSALKTTDPRKFSPIDIAYLDTFTILSNDNQCSQFFGGRYAVSALTELVQHLKPKYFDGNITIRMSGDTTTFQSQATGFSFRMFDKAEVNLGGSFFRNNGRGSVSNLFPANTRETRVVVLLHELGHLVRNAKREWLLPDDGASAVLSLANTERVVSVCRQQIDSLSKVSVAEQLETVMSNKLAAVSPQ